MIIKFAKLREDVKIPERANPSDAGMDVFYNDLYEREVPLFPGDSCLLGTGIKLEIPHGYMIEVKNRSSIAAKKDLIIKSCVCDPGFAGEILINLHNIGKHFQKIVPGDKIAQLVMIPVVHFRISEVEEEKLYDEQVAMSNRREGGFGSTDVKTKEKTVK